MPKAVKEMIGLLAVIGASAAIIGAHSYLVVL